jgi:hypothetical protein
MHTCYVSHNDHKGITHKQTGCSFPSGGTEAYPRKSAVGKIFLKNRTWDNVIYRGFLQQRCSNIVLLSYGTINTAHQDESDRKSSNGPGLSFELDQGHQNLVTALLNSITNIHGIKLKDIFHCAAVVYLI